MPNSHNPPEMEFNGIGAPIYDEHLFPYFPEDANLDDVRKSIALLCEHLKVSIKRTNRTENGHAKIVLEQDDEET